MKLINDYPHIEHNSPILPIETVQKRAANYYKALDNRRTIRDFFKQTRSKISYWRLNSYRFDCTFGRTQAAMDFLCDWGPLSKNGNSRRGGEGGIRKLHASNVRTMAQRPRADWNGLAKTIFGNCAVAYRRFWTSDWFTERKTILRSRICWHCLRIFNRRDSQRRTRYAYPYAKPDEFFEDGFETSRQWTSVFVVARRLSRRWRFCTRIEA